MSSKLLSLLFLLATAAPLAATVQPTHWYRMGEADPSSAVDAVATTLQDSLGQQALTVTSNGAAPVYAAATLAPADLGVRSSLSLNFSSGQAAAKGELISADTNNFGFELWVKPAAASLTGTHCIAYNGTPGVNGWGMYLVNGQITVRTGPTTSLTEGGIAAGQWTHLGIACNGGITRAYINHHEAYFRSTVAIPAPTGGFTLGAAPDGTRLTQWFAGQIDEVRSFRIEGNYFDSASDFLSNSPNLVLQPLYSGEPLTNGDTYTFDPLGVGSSDYLDLEVQNRPESTGGYSSLGIDIRSAKLTGPDAEDFKLSNQFSIVFEPSTPGTKSAVLSIVSNDPDDSPFLLHLTGVATPAPRLTVFEGNTTDPAARLDDGDRSDIPSTLAGGGGMQTFTLRNDGLADLHFSSSTIKGTNGGDFSASEPAAMTLAPGQSTTFAVTFNPSAPGGRYGALRLLSDAADAGYFLISLRGQGAGPQLQVTGPDGSILQSHAVLAWGDDRYGQTDVPPGLGSVTAIGAGYGYTAAVRSDGSVAVWGLGSWGVVDVPANISGVKAITAGQTELAVVRNDGTVVMWGSGGDELPELSDIKSVALGAFYSLALKNDGTVVSWGFGGSRLNIDGLTGVAAIAAGTFDSLALKNDGTVVNLESDPYGYGDTPAPQVNGATAIAVGWDFRIAALADGTLIEAKPNAADFTLGLPVLHAPVAAMAASNKSFIAACADGSLAVSSFLNQHGNLDPPTGPPRFFTGVAAGDTHLVATYDSLVDFGALDPRHSGTGQSFRLTNTGRQTLHLNAASIGGPGAARYALNADGLPASLAPGASTTLMVSNISQAGPDGATLEILSDAAAMPVFTLRLAGAPPFVPDSPYTVWKLAHFGTAAETGDSADDADPNQNGIPNLMEYAFGSDPLASGVAMYRLPAGSYSSVFGFSFAVPLSMSASGVTMTIQVCEALDAGGALVWKDVAIGSGGFLNAVPGASSIYQVSGSAGASSDGKSSANAVVQVKDLSDAPKRLFRLQVSRP